MRTDLGDLNAFVSVARAGGFRGASRATSTSASGLSEAVRRLETRLGIRLLNRTTRSVAPTEAGKRLLERLSPALTEVESALDVVNRFRDKPAGALRLNVPISAARLVLPRIVPRFLAAYPEIRLEVVAEERFIDVLAAGFDAGIRYDERLEQDMIAVPIGPRTQRFAAAAAPAYLDRHGRPQHPRELLGHACLRGRFTSGAMAPWEFERGGAPAVLNDSRGAGPRALKGRLAPVRRLAGYQLRPCLTVSGYSVGGRHPVLLRFLWPLVAGVRLAWR